MARFFFTQIGNVEMIVKGGKPLGGAVVATQVWMNALHDLGHEVVLANYENDKRDVLEEYSWIEICPVYHQHKGIPVLRWPGYRLPKFFKALKKCNCDYLVESIPTWNSFFVGVLCRILKIKQIIRVANDNMLDHRIKLTHSFFERFFIDLAFRRATFILVQNQFQFEKLTNRFPKQKIVKFSNPFIINTGFLKVKPKMEGYIAWVANFRRQKNLELLYKIALTLPFENFKVAGSPNSSIDKETSFFVDKLKTLSNVEFVGLIPRNEIFLFFSKSKFLLNTSRYEGFSNTFLEAMITGTPILTTNHVNPDGIIDRFDLGLIYENEGDLQIKLNALSEANYMKKSNNCIDYIQENHNHLTLGKLLLEFLKTN
ncbi:glycosyltransferase family 4 protein [Cognataquiflexum aquatile]|uniref:glycosyltransferase family 4 protein n=1 Tax=Cognataquiflexum aquatile TaxID=2249427 RepID=UPI000DE93D52|nr:glycosyltransferase [Cognataquiflexum aquatile]